MSSRAGGAGITPLPELHRPLALERIGAGMVEHSVTATPHECVALASRLAIPALDALTCRFHLRRGPSGRIVADGRLAARLVRVCVVTMDEFPTTVTETFRVVFVPTGLEQDDPDPDADDEIPYEGAMIDLGEAAAEQLALTLDPYPHSPGAALADAPDAAADMSPFAMLARRPRAN